MKRQALMPLDCGEASHTAGVPMISGSSRREGRGLPGGEKPGVSVGPPGTRMFTGTPVPSRALAKVAQLASSAALGAAEADSPPASMVSKLVVTLMMRPQPRLIMGSAANRHQECADGVDRDDALPAFRIGLEEFDPGVLVPGRGGHADAGAIDQDIERAE